METQTLFVTNTETCARFFSLETSVVELKLYLNEQNGISS